MSSLANNKTISVACVVPFSIPEIVKTIVSKISTSSSSFPSVLIVMLADWIPAGISKGKVSCNSYSSADAVPDMSANEIVVS